MFLNKKYEFADKHYILNNIIINIDSGKEEDFKNLLLFPFKQKIIIIKMQ